MKQIEGFSKYKATEDGSIIGPRGNPLSFYVDAKSGFCAVKLFRDSGVRTTVFPHRLIYSTFVQGVEDLTLKHKDGNRLNNAVSNLESVPEVTNEEKKLKASIRNQRYLQKGGDRVEELRKTASETYNQKLRTSPDYSERYEELKQSNRQRVKEWQESNPERVKQYAKELRQRYPEKQVAKVQKRNAAKLKRTMAWADYTKINRLYYMARRLTELTGIVHHVDHVIPLRGKLVSGLHVHENLMVVAYDYNCSKSNKYEIQ